MNFILGLMTAFLVKHFICDFPLQANPWFYKNKGTYGHPGGLAHAYIHMVGTWTILAFTHLSVGTLLLLGLADGVIHYHIDWVKMNVTAAYKLTPTNSEWFWILLGLDQLLHYLTYIGIIWVVT
jgi:hypothetical protein